MALQPRRVARAVPLLVVLRDDAGRPFEELDAAEYLLAVDGVQAHVLALRFVERGGLPEDGVRDTDLPDVVQQCAELKGGQPLGVEAQLAPQAEAEGDDAVRVSARLVVAHLQGRRQRLERRAVGPL